MGTIPASENIFPLVEFAEGAAPATPASGQVRLYAKSDGSLYQKDDAGTETAVSPAAHIADTGDAHDASAISIVDAGTLYTATDVEAALAEVMTAAVGGGIAVSTIDAKGDLLAGTANDTIDNLTVGANGSILQAASGQTTGLIWNAAPTGGRVVLTSGDINPTGSFADVSGATVTITTLARRCLVGVTAVAQVGTASDGCLLDIEIDGVRQGGTTGITGMRSASTGHRQNLSFVYMTDVLSAGSHTFDLQAIKSPGAGTVTLFAGTASPLTLWVAEMLF